MFSDTVFIKEDVIMSLMCPALCIANLVLYTVFRQF